MNTKLEMLEREIERLKIIVELRKSIQTCNETERDCDVCVGMQYAINIIERRLENK